MRMFLRRSTLARDPLPVAMSGVRLGERLLQIGVDDPAVLGPLAAKPGLTGESAVVVPDEAAAVIVRRGVAETGALVNVRVHALDRLPHDDDTFDVTVVHARRGLPPDADRLFAECRRILRPGGRIVILEMGTPTGLQKLLSRKTPADAAETTLQRLERAGFRAARLLGDGDGYRFIEGLTG